MNTRCFPWLRSRPLGDALLALTLFSAVALSSAGAVPQIVPASSRVVAGDDVQLTLSGFDVGGVDVTITLDDQNPVPYSVPFGGSGTLTYAIPEAFDYGTFELRVCETCWVGPEDQAAKTRLTIMSGELSGTGFDVQTRGIEVTQGVRQDIPTRKLNAGSFILVPESTVHVANRRTVVRVYPGFDIAPSAPDDVAVVATLTAYDGPSLLGTLTQTRALAVRRTLTERRSSPQHGVQFTLPSEWVALPSSTPSRSLRFEASFSSPGEAPGFDTNNGASLYGVDFEHVEGIPGTPDGAAFQLRPHFVTQRFETAPGDSTVLFANPFELLPNVLASVQDHMPLADGRQGIRLRGIRFGTFYGPTDLDGMNLFADWSVRRYLPGATMWGQPDNLYYGMFFKPAICAGYSWIGSAYLQAYACPPPYTTVAHELTHAIGSEHAGDGHGEGDGGGFDPSYPDGHGRVEPNTFGYNVYRGLAYPPVTANPPEYRRHDYMSYGPDAFVSAYTWNRVAENLESGTVGVSRSPAMPGAPGPGERGPDDWRMFTGFANTNTLALQVGALFETTPPPAFDPQESDYVVRFYDAFGDLVGELPVLSGEVQDLIDPQDWIFVATPIRMPAEWSTLTFGAGEAVWDTRVRSLSRPTVELTSPSAGFSWPQSGSVLVSWTGFDADGDDLVYRVLGARDEQVFVLASDIEGEQVTIDLDELPGGGTWKIYVEASDGFDSGVSEPAVGSAADKPPLVVIVNPREGESVLVDQLFVADAVFGDPQMTEQEIEEAEIDWFLDGEPVGSGEFRRTRSLPRIARTRRFADERFRFDGLTHVDLQRDRRAARSGAHESRRGRNRHANADASSVGGSARAGSHTGSRSHWTRPSTSPSWRRRRCSTRVSRSTPSRAGPTTGGLRPRETTRRRPGQRRARSRPTSRSRPPRRRW